MIRLGSVAASAALMLCAPLAHAQSVADINFGDDSGGYIDNACDDPRFQGPGMFVSSTGALGLAGYEFKDATDCRAAYQAGTITFAAAASSSAPPAGLLPSQAAADPSAYFAGVAGQSAPAPSGAAPDFGDDSSQWARDGECDDLRFTGPGMAASNTNGHIRKDATDCRAAWNAGTVTLRQGAIPEFAERDDGAAAPAAAAQTQAYAVSDLSEFLPRREDYPDMTDQEFQEFYDLVSDSMDQATASTQELIDALNAEQEAEAALRAELEALGSGAMQPALPPLTLEQIAARPAAPDFGDDNNEYAFDDECDDPRFGGPAGMAAFPVMTRLGHDATDCRTAWEWGEITTVEHWAEIDTSGLGAQQRLTYLLDQADPEIYDDDYVSDDPFGLDMSFAYDFGDNTSPLAFDALCNDPRFETTYPVPDYDAEGGHDAYDCTQSYDAGFAQLKPGQTLPPSREAGALMADIFATDGAAGFREGFAESYDFGDDSGQYANDGECDDPRFAGEGAPHQLDSHLRADATDCRAAYLAGTAEMNDAPPTMGDTLGGMASGTMTQQQAAEMMRDTLGAHVSYYFGDDASILANDNLCDDTRFEGRGMGPGTVNDVNGHDATDCQAAYYAGNVVVRPGAAVPQFNMGDDSGTRPFDGFCDDPRFVGLGAAGEVEEANRFRDATDCQVAWAFGMLIPAEGPPR